MTERDQKFSAPLGMRMRESNGHAYVFVGLECTVGVMIFYDISNPSDAAFVNHCDQPCNKLCGQTPVRLVFLQRILYRTEINFPKQRKGNAGQADNQA